MLRKTLPVLRGWIEGSQAEVKVLKLHYCVQGRRPGRLPSPGQRPGTRQEAMMSGLKARLFVKLPGLQP